MLDAIAQYGIFAGLFIVLLVYTIKQNERRENDYRSTISSLNSIVDCTTQNISKDVDEVIVKVKDVSDDVKQIKHNVNEIKRDVDYISASMPLILPERVIKHE